MTSAVTVAAEPDGLEAMLLPESVGIAAEDELSTLDSREKVEVPMEIVLDDSTEAAELVDMCSAVPEVDSGRDEEASLWAILRVVGPVTV